jgi:hypothetical protein
MQTSIVEKQFVKVKVIKEFSFPVLLNAKLVKLLTSPIAVR